MQLSTKSTIAPTAPHLRRQLPAVWRLKVLSIRPELTIAELRQILLQSAQDIEPPGVDLLSGHGGIDYIAALGRNAQTQTIARIETAGLTLEDNLLMVEVRGVAAADEFSGATLFARPVDGTVSIEMIERTQDLARIAGRQKTQKNVALKKSKKQLAQDEEWLTQAYEWQQRRGAYQRRFNRTSSQHLV